MGQRAWRGTDGTRGVGTLDSFLMGPSPRPSWTSDPMGTPRRAISIHIYMLFYAQRPIFCTSQSSVIAMYEVFRRYYREVISTLPILTRCWNLVTPEVILNLRKLHSDWIRFDKFVKVSNLILCSALSKFSSFWEEYFLSVELGANVWTELIFF